MNLTQEECAEQIGVDETTYQRWESGAAKPSLRSQKRLATVFKCSMEELQKLLILEEEVDYLSKISTETSLQPPTSLRNIWTDDISNLELGRRLRERLGVVESLPVYKNLSVYIDVKNRQGDSHIKYTYDLINCGQSPILGEAKSVWFENPSSGIVIEPQTCVRGPCHIHVRRDYANMKHFFCTFPEAIMPGDSITYGFSYSVERMFTQNHYWDQLVPQLARSLEIRVRHNKGFRFLSAYVEKESRGGLSIEHEPDLDAHCSPAGCLDLTFRKLFPEAQSKYSLHWSFDES